MGEKGVMKAFLVTMAIGVGLAGCMSEKAKPVAAVSAPRTTTSSFGAIVDETGQCTETISFDSAPYKGKPDDALMGLSECQIVALHGEAPLSVMSGASQNSKRETTMLYMETSGKAVYLFSDNRLKRVVR
jgi:hypothetical protein